MVSVSQILPGYYPVAQKIPPALVFCGFVLEVCEKFPGHVRDIFDTWLEMSRTYPGHCREMSGKPPEMYRTGNVHDVSWKCPGNVCEMSRTCLGPIQEMSGKLPGENLMRFTMYYICSLFSNSFLLLFLQLFYCVLLCFFVIFGTPGPGLLAPP